MSDTTADDTTADAPSDDTETPPPPLTVGDRITVHHPNGASRGLVLDPHTGAYNLTALVERGLVSARFVDQWVGEAHALVTDVIDPERVLYDPEVTFTRGWDDG